MKILVINAGSSSIKYQLIDMDNNTLLAKGQADRIGIEGGNFKQKVEGREDYKIDIQMKNHAEAIGLVLDTLTSKENGVIESLQSVTAFCTVARNSRDRSSLTKRSSRQLKSAASSARFTIPTISPVFALASR